MIVSILLPFHNAAPWIEETVRSIQAQSYTHWELIAVNDFSTDDSLDLLQTLAATDERIHIFENTEKGIIPALQLALSYAKGDYLTRMDADDLMPEGRLEVMVNALKSLPMKTVVTGKVRYFSQGDGLQPIVNGFDKLNASRESQSSISSGYLAYEAWLNERVDNNDHYDHIYRECVVASPNWFARTDEIRESDIFSQLVYPEDYDMTFRWMAKGFTIVGIPEITLLWREHPDRTSRNSSVYDQASFFNLKLNWFCALHTDTTHFAILGAGVKGKITARHLIKEKRNFRWFDLEAHKYGAPVLGKTIEHYDKLSGEKLLIAVYPTNKKPLLDFLNEKGFEIGRNAWFL